MLMQLICLSELSCFIDKKVFIHIKPATILQCKHLSIASNIDYRISERETAKRIIMYPDSKRQFSLKVCCISKLMALEKTKRRTLYISQF